MQDLSKLRASKVHWVVEGYITDLINCEELGIFDFHFSYGAQNLMNKLIHFTFYFNLFSGQSLVLAIGVV